MFGFTGLPKDDQGNFLFDIMNNPYIEYVGYAIVSNEGAPTPEYRLSYEFEPCS